MAEDDLGAGQCPAAVLRTPGTSKNAEIKS